MMTYYVRGFFLRKRPSDVPNVKLPSFVFFQYLLDYVHLGDKAPVALHRIKIVLVGNSGVGKTAIAQRYAKEVFDPTHCPTLAASFVQRTVMFGDVDIQYQIWDTAGQEKYNALLPMYLRGADVALVVFDVTDPSFEDIEKWLQALDAYSESFHKFLVANKVDIEAKVPMVVQRIEGIHNEHEHAVSSLSSQSSLVKLNPHRELLQFKQWCTLLLRSPCQQTQEGHQYTQPKAEIFAIEHEMGFLQTSAKTGHNIDILFSTIGTVVVERLRMLASGESVAQQPLTYRLSPRRKSKCCRN